MHAQTITIPAKANEAVSNAASAAMLLATGSKIQRKKLDYQFPQACTPEVHRAWKVMAKDVKKLHDAVSNGRMKVGDDPGAVGDAYRKASRAAHRDSGVTAQMAAHVAIETIAKSFVIDGTYAKLAINPAGISYVAGLVGELQNRSRGLNLDLGLGGLAVMEVYKGRTASSDRATWEAVVANRAYQRETDEHGSPDWSAAEAAFFTTPAPDFAAVLQKIIDNAIVEDGLAEDTSAEDVIAHLLASGDHDDLCQASIYRDIQRLARSPILPIGIPTDPVIDYELLKAIGSQMSLRGLQEAANAAGKDEEAEQHTEAMQPVLDAAMAIRAKTLAGLMGRVWLVEDWAPRAESLTGQDLEWKIVRSLLDDVKALYATHEPQALIGSKAVTAGWTAAGAAHRCGVVPASIDPVAIAAE
jgi:hypothetical protein